VKINDLEILTFAKSSSNNIQTSNIRSQDTVQNILIINTLSLSACWCFSARILCTS